MDNQGNSSDRPLSGRPSTVNMISSSLVLTKFKLHTTFTSVDEADLYKFLRGKKLLTKTEKQYLVKYILKGIPEHIRGKVRFENLCLGAGVDDHIRG